METETQVKDTNSKLKGQKKDAIITKAQSSEAVQVSATPDNMIMIALNSGRSMEEIKALIELRNSEIARLAKIDYIEAKRQFQKTCPPIYKNAKAHVGMYADLQHVESTIKDAVSECGFTYDWKTDYDGNDIKVSCILSHIGGHSEIDTMKAAADKSGNKADIHASSSTVSYLRRYTLLGVLGKSTGKDDDDGQAASSKSKLPVMTDAQFKGTLQKITQKAVTLDTVQKNFALSEEQWHTLKIAEDSK